MPRRSLPGLVLLVLGAPAASALQTPDAAATEPPARRDAPLAEPPEDTGGLAAADGSVEPAPGPRWQAFDGVALIVNEEILTRGNLLRLYERIRSNRAISTREQALALEERVLVEQTDGILGYQAGQDLGIPPERVEGHVADYHRRRKDREGIVAYGEDIRALAADRTTYDESLQSEIYRSLWEQQVTGRLPGPRGRVAVDRYIRPGALRYHYELVQSDPRLLEVIGGTPERVVFQHLYVAPKPGESEAQARERAATLRARALAGEDFDELVAQHSAAPQDGGIEEPLSLADLERASQEVRLFARQARPGEISAPIPVVRDGRLQAFRLMKLRERLPAEIPPFTDQAVQTKLRAFIAKGQEEVRVHEALDDLYGAAYIWPPEVFDHRPPLPPRISEP